MNSSYRRARATALAVLLVAGASAADPAGAGPLPRLAVSLREQAGTAAFQHSCSLLRGAAVVVPAGSISTDGDGPSAEDIDGARRLLTALPAGSDVLLHLQIAPGGAASLDEGTLESRLSAAVATLPLAAVRGLVLQVVRPAGDNRLLRFALATLAIKARGANPGLSLTMGFPPGVSTSLVDLARQAAVYADAVVVSYEPGWRDDATWIERSLHKPVVIRLDAGSPQDPQAAARAYLDALIDADDLTIETVWADLGSTDGLASLCSTASRLASALSDAFAATTAAAVPVSIAVDGIVQPAVRAYLDTRSADVSMLMRTQATRERPRTLSFAGRSEKPFEIDCADALDGRPVPSSGVPAPGQAPTRACTVSTSHAFVTVRWAGADERIAEAVNVTGRAELRVEEILARWQQARETERQAFQNAMASCLLSLHFEPVGFGGGFDVALELRHFLDHTGVRDWVQTGFFLNGVRLKSRREFPLPQLEPERVLSQPLQLRLDEQYAYSLAGTDTVGGVLSYVVRIVPKDPNDTLYRGKVWIDGIRFRNVRAELEQRGGRSNVVSHVETQEFEAITDRQGREFTVIRRIYVQEVLNAAGRSFLLEKTFDFSDYLVNTEGFASALAEARASEDPMYRDTATGLRSLRKEGTERVVESSDSKRIRSLVMGAMYDGTFRFPIPIAGLSFVDFDFRQSGNQLSVFFAGPILAANLSRPLNTRLRLGLDVALSAVPQRSRVYAADREVTAENLWKFDEIVGGLASWQPTPTLSLTGSSHLIVSAFRTTSDTDPAFRVPARAFTIEHAAEAKFFSHGYGVTTTILRGDRLGWGQVGYANATQPVVQPAYLKYSAEFGKQGYVGRFTKLGVSLAYYGGDGLDRFSQYRPSFLTRPRIRGIPSGTDAFDDVGIAGVAYGFNVMELVKFEGAYSHAWARNRQESDRFRNFDGVEFNVGTSAPWNMFLQGTISYAVRGNTARYDSRWSVYLLLFKPLRR